MFDNDMLADLVRDLGREGLLSKIDVELRLPPKDDNDA